PNDFSGCRNLSEPTVLGGADHRGAIIDSGARQQGGSPDSCQRNNKPSWPCAELGRPLGDAIQRGAATKTGHRAGARAAAKTAGAGRSAFGPRPLYRGANYQPAA